MVEDWSWEKWASYEDLVGGPSSDFFSYGTQTDIVVDVLEEDVPGDDDATKYTFQVLALADTYNWETENYDPWIQHIGSWLAVSYQIYKVNAGVVTKEGGPIVWEADMNPKLVDASDPDLAADCDIGDPNMFCLYVQKGPERVIVSTDPDISYTYGALKFKPMKKNNILGDMPWVVLYDPYPDAQ